MFDTLTDKLTGVFSRLTNRGRLTDKDVDDIITAFWKVGNALSSRDKAAE